MWVGTASDAFLLHPDEPHDAGDGCPGSRGRRRHRLVVGLAVTVFAILALAGAGHGPSRRCAGRNGARTCSGAGLRPSPSDLSHIRSAILCLVNRERADRGERPLAFNDRLEHAAQSHTESMAFRNYFEHDGPRGETPLSRMRATGYISQLEGLRSR